MNTTVRHSLLARRSAFTLVEVLVATAVLSIVVVGLAQILSIAMQTWQQGLIRTNCSTKARVVLDSVSADIQRGVFRPDLHNFPTPASYTAPTFTFYTRAAGASTGTGTVRPVSLVTYQLSTSSNLQGCLLRSENTINWGASSNLNFLQPLTPVSPATVPATSVPPNDLLSKGVAGFEMLFFLSDGTTVPAKYYQYPTSAPVVMIGVAVAVIDDQSMTQLQAANSADFTNIQNALVTALSLKFSQMTGPPYTSTNYGRSIKALWDPALVQFYQAVGYPKALATGLQTYERFVPCTPFH